MKSDSIWLVRTQRVLHFARCATLPVLQILGRVRKPFQLLIRKKNMEETSGRTTEEGSPSQDGQMCNSCHIYTTKNKKSQNIQYMITEFLMHRIIMYAWRMWVREDVEQPQVSPAGAESYIFLSTMETWKRTDHKITLTTNIWWQNW